MESFALSKTGEEQVTGRPLADDRTVTFQVYEPERLRMPVSNLAVSGVSPTVLRPLRLCILVPVVRR